MIENPARGSAETARRSHRVRIIFAFPILAALLLVVLSSCDTIRFAFPVIDNGTILYDPAAGLLIPRGPWERYEGLFEESQLEGREFSLVMSQTKSALFSREPAKEQGRSYRLTLIIPGPAVQRSWIFMLPLVPNSARILINGIEEEAAGRAVDFATSGDRISILVQVPPGAPGIDGGRLAPGFAILGESNKVAAALTLAGEISVVIIAGFALSGLLILLLFNLWTSNLEFLAFALLLLAEGLHYFVNAALLFPIALPLDGLPDLRHALTFNFRSLTLIIFFASLLAERRKRIAWIALVPVPLFALAEVLLPDRLFLLHSISLSYYSANCLAAFGLLIWSAFAGSKRARWLLFGPVFLLAAVPLRIYLPNSPEVAYLYDPLSTLAFSLVTIVGLIRKIRYSFQNSETLTGYVSDVADTVKRFIPQEFLHALDKRDVVDLRLGDHVKKDMTIFFSDIRAFTELSERLTVEENFAFINSYLSRVVPLIKENGGFVDKYIGDAIMALYPGPEGPDEAIKTAIEMQGKMNEYNGHRAKMGYRSVSMGVGIHAGSLMLGVVGVHDRMENTVISDSVNLASRLQAITKAFNISLAISEEVFKAVKDPGAYTFRFIGKVKVKGKAEPVSVFEIFDGIETSLYDRKMKANTFFEQGMLAYYQKDFSGAMYYFKRVLETLPEDGASSFYLDTCMHKASL